MCGRYTTVADEEMVEMRAIIREILTTFGDGAIRTGEILPSNIAPVLTLKDGRLAPVPVTWGFPKWNGKGVIINARSETALNKRTFSKPLLTRRCVVPSTGFFEWTHIRPSEPQLSLFSDSVNGVPSPKGPKAKLLFNVPGESMLYMAGMIETVTDALGNQKDVFCILTTAAKHSISRFHDRMPVILGSGEREAWVESETFMREVLARDGIELNWQIAS